jgi:cysteinyl-tRNA synthetase
MALRVYNTLTRQKEEFKPLQPGKVGMYVCGPTVYKPSHIGHMVGPVIFDTVKRYLEYVGYDVTWVVNITDVDDKLIVRAKELGTTVKELAEKMTADYLECLKKLNVTGIDRMPKATEHIPEMIGIIQGLIDKGFAYPAGGDVYFDISKDHDYGKLCNRDPAQLEAGARIEVSDKKRNPGDFALWKGSKPGEPDWPSPWGPGRPGWHIECSAMSMKYLGQTFDIHGGGLDLQFPHHENELAQSESYADQTFARYWMHNGLLTMGKAKMAGSVGNVVNIADLLQKHSAETVRFLILSTHYRSPIEYGEERLAEVKRSLESFYRFFERYQRITGNSFFQIEVPPTFKAELKKAIEQLVDPQLDTTGLGAEVPTRLARNFFDAMNDDFNTAAAIAVLYGFVATLNQIAETHKLEEHDRDPNAVEYFHSFAIHLRALSQVLGLFDAPVGKRGDNDAVLNGLMQLLIDLRADARKAKNFALGDQIRKRLGELGITLEDRAGGTGWRLG